MILGEAKLYDVDGRVVKFDWDKLEKALDCSIDPDMDYNCIYLPFRATKALARILEGHGFEVSIYEGYHGIGSYVDIHNGLISSVSYGNGLLGDGSVGSSFGIVFCENPAEHNIHVAAYL